MRADIQVLRAAAVLAVIVYHLKPAVLPGGFIGVDVFFVISAYLITGHLLRDAGGPAHVRLARFYAARVRRLLPASAVVLVAVLCATPYLLPDTRWRDTAGDVIASALSVENWALAQRSVDYLAQDQASSVVQHFWSLSVEEQFYLGWPLLVLVTAALIRRTRFRRTARATPIGFAAVSIAVVVVSLGLSVSYTAHNPARAYFVTFTRAWELAIGATLAALSSSGAFVRWRRAWSVTAQILGWGLIATSLAAISGVVPYPGWIAVVPTAGAALTLLGGDRESGDRWARGAASRPFVLIGDMSYSLYLWHWPVIVVLSARALLDHWWGVLLAVVLIAVLSTLSYRFVESLRFGPALRSTGVALVIAGVSTALITAQASALSAVVHRAQTLAEQTRAVFVDELPTATGLPAPAAPRLSGGFVPASVIAYDDWPSCPTSGVDESRVVICRYGGSAVRGRVVIVGDSHVKQWLPALVPAALQKGYAVDAFVHDSCPFASGSLWRSDELPRSGTPYDACRAWNIAVSARIGRTPNLRLVVTSSYGNDATAYPPGDSIGMRRADRLLGVRLAAALRPVVARGVPVLQLHDTPRPGRSVPDCVAALGTDAAACRVPLADAQTPQTGAVVVAHDLLREEGGSALAHYANFDSRICPGEECRPIRSSMLVFRDSNHLTATYARSLLPAVSEVMTGAIAARG